MPEKTLRQLGAELAKGKITPDEYHAMSEEKRRRNREKQKAHREKMKAALEADRDMLAPKQILVALPKGIAVLVKKMAKERGVTQRVLTELALTQFLIRHEAIHSCLFSSEDVQKIAGFDRKTPPIIAIEKINAL
jgi:hypothetical protein